MEPTPKIVDIDTCLPVLADLMEQGHTVSLTVTGHSMTPFLVHGRDRVCLRKPADPLKRGDMVLFRRRNGVYVMHRVCRADPDGTCCLVGDGQRDVEGPIAPEQVLGLVTRVCRKGRWLGPESFWWRFFAGPWLWLRPLRPLLCRTYSRISRIWKKGGSPYGTEGS